MVQVKQRKLSQSRRHFRVFLVGSGIQKSLSPAIHNALFKKLKIDADYSLLDVTEHSFESDLKKSLDAGDVLGFNVTAPFKEQIISHLAEMDRVASAIAAVNTVKVARVGLMKGYNTDADGVIASLNKLGVLGSKKTKKRARKKAVIMGAGGAARACAYALLSSGFDSLTIANRSSDRAEALVSNFKNLYPRAEFAILGLNNREVSKAIMKSRILINAVSDSRAGLEGYPITLDFKKVQRGFRFLDLSYKHQTHLLRTALAYGIVSLDGLPMLVEQARRSFEIWTGISPSQRLVNSVTNREIRRAA